MSAASIDDVFRALVASAIQAPSSHNTQPWLFRATGDGLALLADRTRALPVNDPHDRELLISCGAALFNVRVAAADQGWSVRLSLMPGGDEDLLAVLAREAADKASPADLADLMPAVTRRRTCRQGFVPGDIGPLARQAVLDAARHEDAQLLIVDDAQRQPLAALVAEADEMLWADARWRRELAAWMHPRRRGDGLSLPGLAVPITQAVVRTFDLGHRRAAHDRQVVDTSPLLAVLVTEGDNPRDHLQAGQALQRVLLTACQHGLQASYLNQPVEVEAVRHRLRALMETAGYPQIVLLLGRPARPVPAAPRRPVDEVIVAD